VDVMEDIVYNSIKSYFNALSKLGYMRNEEVNKLLALIIIEEFTYYDFRGLINKEDYMKINKSLYNLFGKSCLIPYPNFCKIKDMNKLRLGDMSELAHRVKINEDNIKEIQETKVVKTLNDVIEEIDNIIPVE